MLIVITIYEIFLPDMVRHVKTVVIRSSFDPDAFIAHNSCEQDGKLQSTFFLQHNNLGLTWGGGYGESYEHCKGQQWGRHDPHFLSSLMQKCTCWRNQEVLYPPTVCRMHKKNARVVPEWWHFSNKIRTFVDSHWLLGPYRHSELESMVTLKEKLKWVENMNRRVHTF